MIVRIIYKLSCTYENTAFSFMFIYAARKASYKKDLSEMFHFV